MSSIGSKPISTHAILHSLGEGSGCHSIAHIMITFNDYLSYPSYSHLPERATMIASLIEKNKITILKDCYKYPGGIRTVVKLRERLILSQIQLGTFQKERFSSLKKTIQTIITSRHLLGDIFQNLYTKLNQTEKKFTEISSSNTKKEIDSELKTSAKLILSHMEWFYINSRVSSLPMVIGNHTWELIDKLRGVQKALNNNPTMRQPGMSVNWNILVNRVLPRSLPSDIEKHVLGYL